MWTTLVNVLIKKFGIFLSIAKYIMMELSLPYYMLMAYAKFTCYELEIIDIEFLICTFINDGIFILR